MIDNQSFLLTTVQDAFSKGLRIPAVGIEIEVENFPNDVALDFDKWKVKEDNSLKNKGYEFVSDPLEPAQIGQALDNIKDVLSRCDPFSGRTSVHIHVNAGYLALAEVYSVYTLTLLLQDLLQLYGGRSRVGNNFALSFSQGPRIHHSVLKSVEEGRMFKQQKEERYSFVNFNPLNTFGTIEFRFFRGLITKEGVLNAVKLCNWLVSSCIGKTPADILRFVDTQRFIEEFHVRTKDFFLTEEIKSSVWSNKSIAYEVVSAHPSEWDLSVKESDWRSKIADLKKLCVSMGYRNEMSSVFFSEEEFNSKLRYNGLFAPKGPNDPWFFDDLRVVAGAAQIDEFDDAVEEDEFIPDDDEEEDNDEE